MPTEVIRVNSLLTDQEIAERLGAEIEPCLNGEEGFYADGKWVARRISPSRLEIDADQRQLIEEIR